jgi:putative membrane-bound dehydrogenase-like protein
MVSLRALALLAFLLSAHAASAQIPVPADTPKPLTPAESAKAVKLPPGFRLEAIASEPLIREPTAMCWDERGRLFVCELHGFNYEGQFDIDELNKTGKLDKEVRRLFADPKHVEAAKKEQYGTIKLLVDSTGNGKYDKAITFADKIPACYGMVPYKGGLIVACAPDILYLADRDGDGVAEVREVLFTGFGDELMERRISDPHWGLDGWIYFGRGGANHKITGPRLKVPVELPGTDFRIKPDGSAIEAITGSTKTIGITWTEWGDRFVISTNTPALFVPPLAWNYLSRNPYVAASLPEVNLSSDQRVYPISAPHPWRTKRAEDPGFSKFYQKRYGLTESAANGYFTSGCSPLIYQDIAIPALRGNILTCEPAQNMLHRGIIERTGVVPTYRRPKGEEKSEFLASADIWFHPIGLAHAPDGSIVIADFYREIIEDYSAIPRYLQQQYGLTNGKDHGRVWRLTHADAIAAPPADMSKLTAEELVKETASGHFWRRETARRLLLEHDEKVGIPMLTAMLPKAVELWSILNIAYTLNGLGGLKAPEIEGLLAHANPAVRVHGLRFSERYLSGNADLQKKVFSLIDDKDAGVLLQLALTLGECSDPQAPALLSRLARERNDERWMATAILSSLAGRSGEMLAELLGNPKTLGKADILVEPLCTAIAARRDPKELSAAIVLVAELGDVALQRTCVRGFRAALKSQAAVALNGPAQAALKKLASSGDEQVRGSAESLMVALKQEDPAKRKARIAAAIRTIGDVQATVEERLAAVPQLAFDDDPEAIAALFTAIPTSTPRVREAILTAVFSRVDRFGDILTALEKKLLEASALTAIQRTALLESREPAIRERAAKLLKRSGGASDETFKLYTAALDNKRDPARGAALFKEKCAICHQAHGVGIAVGPNLSSEFQRAEITIIRDILAPNDVISPGFNTYNVETLDGQTFSGILVGESASSITLRGAEGKENLVLRKDIDRLKVVAVSLMPEDLIKTLGPQDLADVIAWLRDPPTKVVLIDEDPAIAGILKDAKATARMDETEKFSGKMSLLVTPPGVSAPRVKGWDYKIRETPAPGEFRYLRLAWKAEGNGAMVETAANGLWPEANAATRRYYSGKNTEKFAAIQLTSDSPKEWTVVTIDLWKDARDYTLTGISLIPMGGPGWFDKVELLRSNEEEKPSLKK